MIFYFLIKLIWEDISEFFYPLISPKIILNQKII